MNCPFCMSVVEIDFNVCERCKNKRRVDLYLPFEQTVSLNLPFELSNYQQDLSNKIRKCEEKNIYLNAVCGAGKTEIVLAKVFDFLKDGKYVAWVIPRREIVIELFDRLSNYFQGVKLVKVCSGHTNDLLGHLIIMTAHQAYRYHRYFDLLILDEFDAFPFTCDDYLRKIVNLCAHESATFLLMSATQNISIMKEFLGRSYVSFNLNLRPSGRPLPVPVWQKTSIFLLKFVKDFYKFKDRKRLVFLPTVKMTRYFSLVFRSDYVHAQLKNKNIVIEKFRRSKSGSLFSSTVLERGVTFHDVIVFVLFSDHKVFNESTLIQIAGRVERGMKPKKSYCFFYSGKYSKEVEKCIENIQNNNCIAPSVMKK